MYKEKYAQDIITRAETVEDDDSEYRLSEIDEG